MSEQALKKVSEVIQQGGVIAYPTEAVWGLGCDPNNESAVQKILKIKQRPWQKGLVIVAASLEQLQPWLLPLTEQDLQQIAPTWPGPVSWVLPCKDTVPNWLKGEHNTLAVRVSAHPLVQKLCLACGPLVSTSANPTGAEPARTQQEVKTLFPDQIDLIIPGELGGRAQPSEIRTLTGIRLR